MSVAAANAAPRPPGPTPSPVVVVTGMRDTDRSRWLATLSSAYRDPADLRRTVVSLQAQAGHLKAGEVLRDLLFALGKSPHVTGGAKHDEGLFTVPAAWLLARHTREIIVNDAQQLPTRALEAVTELAAGVQVRLWLIGYHNKAGVLDTFAEDTGADLWTLERFDDAWGRDDTLPGRTTFAPPVLRSSDLPASSALTFRADCRTMLPTERFADVDEVFRAEHSLAGGVFDRALDHNKLAEHLRRRVRQATSTDQVVVTVRAIEAAALVRGMYVDVDLPVLVNAAERNPRPGRYDLADVAALDAYARTTYPAACVLAMCEIPPNEIAILTVGDVNADASQVTADGLPVAIPTPLQPLLHAHLLTRLFDGAGSGDPLLLSELGKPVTTNWVSRRIKLAEVECAVRLARPRYDRKRLDVFDWLTAHGLAVRSIHGQQRRKQRS